MRGTEEGERGLSPKNIPVFEVPKNLERTKTVLVFLFFLTGGGLFEFERERSDEKRMSATER